VRARRLLGVGRCGVDRHDGGTGGGVGVLAGVDGPGGEAPAREILTHVCSSLWRQVS
jgi:hypothetical protein